MNWAILCAVSVSVIVGFAHRAEAACTFEQIKALIATGFTPEQAMQACGVKDETGSTDSKTENAEDPPPETVAPENFSLGLARADIGDDGVWKKYVRDDAYVVQNKFDLEAYFLLFSTEPLKPQWDSVNLDVRFSHEKLEEGIIGPGLVYTTDPKQQDLRIFNFRQDGTVSLYKMVGDKLDLVTSKQQREFGLEEYKFQSYALVEGKSNVELFVNGKPTGLTTLHDGATPATFGLATFGIGSYEFRNFVQKPKQ